jgi:hypothetical protein
MAEKKASCFSFMYSLSGIDGFIVCRFLRRFFPVVGQLGSLAAAGMGAMTRSAITSSWPWQRQARDVGIIGAGGGTAQRCGQNSGSQASTVEAASAMTSGNGRHRAGSDDWRGAGLAAGGGATSFLGAPSRGHKPLL